MYTFVKKLRRSRVSQVTFTDNRYIMPRSGLVTIVKLSELFIGCLIGIISTCLP